MNLKSITETVNGTKVSGLHETKVFTQKTTQKWSKVKKVIVGFIHPPIGHPQRTRWSLTGKHENKGLTLKIQ